MAVHIKTANAVTSLKATKATPDYGKELDMQVAAHGLPKLLAEFRFAAPLRQWRADRAYVELKLLFEIEGGAWIQGRHTRGKGYEADCEKYNTAQMMGYKVFRFSPAMCKEKDGRALAIVKRAYANAMAEREASA
jgi:very-short-patch-repair endonuclease